MKKIPTWSLPIVMGAVAIGIYGGIEFSGLYDIDPYSYAVGVIVAVIIKTIIDMEK